MKNSKTALNASKRLLDQIKKRSESAATHYTEQAELILRFRTSSFSSEREISKLTGISKSEVHRLLGIARLSKELKDTAKKMKVEKYVLVKIAEEKNEDQKEKIVSHVLSGNLRKLAQLRLLKNTGTIQA